MMGCKLTPVIKMKKASNMMQIKWKCLWIKGNGRGLRPIIDSFNRKLRIECVNSVINRFHNKN